MPQKQTIMWTALPNGIKSGGSVLQLSVFVSPRLETTEGLPRPQLSQFPDFVAWTAKMQKVQFAVQFEGSAAVPATRVGPAVEPELWAALFKPTTYVAPYQVIDYSDHIIYAHPVANVSAFVKSQYQKVGAASPTEFPARSLVSQQLAPLSLYEAPATPAPVAQQVGVKAGTKPAAAKPVMQQVVIPTPLKTFVSTLRPHVQSSATRNLNALIRPSLSLKSTAVDAFQSIYQEMQQNRAVRSSATLQPTRDFLQVRMQYPKLTGDITPLTPPDIDFHELVSTLGNYPELMRRLGLVIDLEVPIPSGVANSTVKVLPSWPADAAPSSFSTDVSPKTACTLDAGKGRFFARPETADSKIVGGLLNLSDEKSYPVVHVDVPGSALKMVNLADRLASSSVLQTAAASSALHPMALTTSTAQQSTAGTQAATAAEAEATAPLPALRTAGISLAQTNRASWLAGVMAKTALKNQALAGNAPDQVINYADDLVRGYRVDVWDGQSKSWHSLCRRKGTYNFFEANLTRQYDDEGFVQLGVTQPVASTSGGEPPKDLYLQESMFTWNGWSLCAPRPGKTIAPDGTPQRLDDPAIAQTRASSDFKMVASFAPQPGSLPRLRFANTYRVRARVVDLAGNSLAYDVPDPADFSMATGPHLYTRYEPVVAPLAVVTRTLDGTKSPGESLYRPVIRSNYDKSASDYASLYASLVSDSDYKGYTLRLIAPPKTSEAMAERHSMFDSPSGAMKKDSATYQMIAVKADGAFALDPLTRLPIQPKLEIPYLPDPLCRGASLALLDSASHVTATAPPLSFYPSAVDWPGAVPLLLKVTEGAGKTSWQWDEGSRTLTVQLAKAEVATFNLSSWLGDGDVGARNQQSLGVWSWIVEAAPANLAQLKQSVASGRHWMVTPSHAIVLVHAVQQPLIAPQFHSLAPNRQLGETFAYIADDQAMPIDGKSTVKVDFEAAWQEPLDDPSDPNGPKTLNGSAHVKEWKITADQTAIEIKTSVALPQSSVSEATPVTPAAKSKTHVVAAPVVQQKVVMPDGKAASAKVISPVTALKPGTLIPTDVRAVRPVEVFPATLKFGYSWRHDFGDTKYRKVNYSAVATTRFAEYFPIKDPAQLSRTSPAVAVDVPNSARPPRPEVLYVVPTFEWEKKSQVTVDKNGVQVGPVTIPNLKGVGTISARKGGGLRVYLDRPWYGSGDGELLGVIIWPNPALPIFPVASPIVKGKKGKSVSTQDTAALAVSQQRNTAGAKAAASLLAATSQVPEVLRQLVTQWGMDPIWQTTPLPQDLPRLENFENTVKTATNLTLEELADKAEPSPDYYRVGVAGYKPEYDKDRGLWYCDINLNFGNSYFPFIRMALVRYQPISVENAHLSRVVLADFAQLTPDRTATIVVDPKNPKKIDLAVVGTSYQASKAAAGPSTMEVTVEAKPVGADGDLGWVPVPEATISLGAQTSPAATVWRGQIRLDRYKVPKLQELRLVIREYETFLADATQPQMGIAAMVSPTQPARRLVYADVLKIGPSA